MLLYHCAGDDGGLRVFLYTLLTDSKTTKEESSPRKVKPPDLSKALCWGLDLLSWTIQASLASLVKLPHFILHQASPFDVTNSHLSTT